MAPRDEAELRRQQIIDGALRTFPGWALSAPPIVILPVQPGLDHPV
ncbi:hypothetical protein [Chloroflexus sp.]